MEYKNVAEIEAEHEAQEHEELEIDLEDLEDEFIIDEEESELDYDIADSFAGHFDCREEFCEIIMQKTDERSNLINKIFLNEIFSERWIGRRGTIEWPSHSPDLTSLNFFFCSFLKGNKTRKLNQDYKIKPRNLNELRIIRNEH
ncbi:hypothetical protein ALC53_08096 [Atta colombica]|uniref:PiggyBac transposable element-derived protein domain-containing protein n=1 Tax=Atta colombica TaxID=520822 RepID=A0A151I2E4_9HYME|nr:hypothetical protein ALC53_08096 [Atta colombica]